MPRYFPSSSQFTWFIFTVPLFILIHRWNILFRNPQLTCCQRSVCNICGQRNSYSTYCLVSVPVWHYSIQGELKFSISFFFFFFFYLTAFVEDIFLLLHLIVDHFWSSLTSCGRPLDKLGRKKNSFKEEPTFY